MGEILARSLLPLLLFLLLSFLSILRISTSNPTYLSNDCPSSTTLTPKYHSNLNILLHSLSSNSIIASRAGFYSSAAADGTSDAVYGLFLCRGDMNVTACSDCVNAATSIDLPKMYCPDSKVAMIWYDECIVRYSDKPIYGLLNETIRVSLASNQIITGNQAKFSDILGNVITEVVTRASIGDKSGKKYATGTANLTSLKTLYSMAQCTPDLTSSNCYRCLTIAKGLLELEVRQGDGVLMPSCFVRYETNPFYNVSADFSLPAPSLPSLPPTGISSGNSPVKRGNKIVSSKVIIAIVFPVVVISGVLFAICRSLTRKKAKYHPVNFKIGGVFTTVESLRYDLSTLQFATNNFAEENKLGRGGFGVVYKGTLQNEQVIAVKRLSISSRQGVEDFQNEVLLVAKLQHRNLVKLLGYCLEGKEKLLIYEYVPNKSLDHFVFDPVKQAQLDWNTRYRIIGGIARGMLYLHQDSRLRIVHRDMKAGNVLLGMDMNPKIADFGMARIFGMDQTHCKTNRVVGTYGYMAPEYAMHGQFSDKSDVYSFGVLMLEIISGQRINAFCQSSSDAQDLLAYAWKLWKDGKPQKFVDPAIRDSFSYDEVMRCIQLGLLCVQHDSEKRPTMARIVHKLDSVSATIPLPERPGVSIKSISGSDKSTSKALS